MLVISSPHEKMYCSLLFYSSVLTESRHHRKCLTIVGSNLASYNLPLFCSSFFHNFGFFYLFSVVSSTLKRLLLEIMKIVVLL